MDTAFYDAPLSLHVWHNAVSSTGNQHSGFLIDLLQHIAVLTDSAIEQSTLKGGKKAVQTLLVQMREDMAPGEALLQPAVSSRIRSPPACFVPSLLRGCRCLCVATPLRSLITACFVLFSGNSKFLYSVR
jgi:hypothetical protein